MNQFEQARVCVMGLGYIGLPTAALLATRAFHVIGVDTDREALEQIGAGNVRRDEPDLTALVELAFQSEHLILSPKPRTADVFIIAVPTPINGDQSPDLEAVSKAAADIASVLRRGNLVILESTVPPGTTEKKVVPLLEGSGLEVGNDFMVAYSPERVLPGRLITEIIENDRIVGGVDAQSAAAAASFYRLFVRGEVSKTDAATAEFVKLIENTYRDVNIALANEFAHMAEVMKLDVWRAIELANRHPRVQLHRPGPGVGGHCVAVDPWFLISAAPEAAALTETARRQNDAVPARIAGMIECRVPRGARIAILGASYKPNVGDIRESPALRLTDLLRDSGYRVAVIDPLVSEGTVEGLTDLETGTTGADALVLTVPHQIFTGIEPASLRSLMQGRLVFDLANSAGPEWRDSGFEVVRLGAG